MKSSLESLDELILNKHQRITERARKYGKTKYDLALTATGLSTGGLVGAGAYFGILAYGAESILYAVGGTCSVAMGIKSYYGSKKRYSSLESKETDLVIRTGASIPPRTDVTRPIHLGLAAAATCSGIAGIYLENLVIGSNPKVPELNLALGLAITAIGGFYLGNTMARYFLNTTMFPPSKSKQPLWKQAWNYAKSKVTPTPELQPQEIQRYQTIDEVA